MKDAIILIFANKQDLPDGRWLAVWGREGASLIGGGGGRSEFDWLWGREGMSLIGGRGEGV